MEDKDVFAPINVPLFEWVLENIFKNAIDAILKSDYIEIKGQADAEQQMFHDNRHCGHLNLHKKDVYDIDIYQKISASYVLYLDKKKSSLREVNARLQALNPDAVLDRGYSVTRTMPDAIVVRDPQKIFIGQDLEVTVAKGKLICRVKGK